MRKLRLWMTHAVCDVTVLVLSKEGKVINRWGHDFGHESGHDSLLRSGGFHEWRGGSPFVFTL